MTTSMRQLSNYEAQSSLDRFQLIVEKRVAPSVSTGHSMQHEVFWPKPPLSARCIPDGVMSLDHEDGYDYDLKLDEFMGNHGGQDVVFWAIGGEHKGLFTGTYSSEVRVWLKADLVLSPTIILSQSEDVFLISDEQLHFTVVGGDLFAITDLERVFGGSDTLEQNFRDWADAGLAGFNGDRREWAHRYLIRWCGWDSAASGP